jgi:quaternary ammonium compound-resistance protein SugE
MAWVLLLAAGLVEFVWAFTIKLSQGYTVWTGISTVSAFVVGVVILGEPLTIGRVLAAALIVAGLSLMKLSTSD